jgi:predicted enzyme related to lactoylglutathione lyase
MFGLETYEPIERVSTRLAEKGVRMGSEVIRNAEIGNFIDFEDMDGNSIYIWEITPNMLPEGEAAPESNELESSMFSGGHAIVYVSNMDAAVRFYTKVLGLKLTNRFDDHWATIEAGNSLVIGLHPQSPKHPAPGTKGSIMLGFSVDEPIERVLARLTKHGVRITSEVVRQDTNGFAGIEDMDGNSIYIWDGEPALSGAIAPVNSGSM